MSLFTRAIRRTMNFALGEAKILNTGVSSGKIASASSLKHSLDLLSAEAFDLEKGRIDYTRLKNTPGYKEYRQQAATLQKFSLQSLTTPEEKRAFWLNLYNAITIDAVVLFGIQETIREVPKLGFFRKAAYLIDGQTFSLDDIEHGILRGNRRHPAYPVVQFDKDDLRSQYIVPLDPQVHFALTCASRSCPPIAFYEGAKLETQLKLATENFLTGGGCLLASDQRTLLLSTIFKWYAGDFGGEQGVLLFLARHHPDPQFQALLQSRQLPINYVPYDWRLNKVSA